jgi:hypothetical protein
MKHIKLFEAWEENFKEEGSIQLDITDRNELDLDSKTLTVYYDSEGWDKYSEYKRALKYLASNENDTMIDDLIEALYSYGLTIDFSRKHSYNIDQGWVDFNLLEIPHPELANDPEGRKALQKKGYTEEEIEALKTASEYGIA